MRTKQTRPRSGAGELFRTVKEGVPMEEAARAMGLTPNPGGMVCCPFHPDRNPSMKLYDDHFYCFGCHAHGDVVDLLCKMTDLRPIEAAKALAEYYQLKIEN